MAKLSAWANQPTVAAIRAKKIVQIDDPTSDPRLADLIPPEKQQTAVLIVPALYGEQVVGVIRLGRVLIFDAVCSVVIDFFMESILKNSCEIAPVAVDVWVS